MNTSHAAPVVTDMQVIPVEDYLRKIKRGKT